MKKLFLIMLLVVFLFASVIPAVAMRDTWSADHNKSGLSECAIQVIKKIVLTDEYDWVVARFNPLTSIGGSGCTIVNGTTSFPTAGGDYWYTQGGVTLNPQQFKMNKILTYWFTEETHSGTKGTSGSSPQFTYQWVSNIGAGTSATTDWKIKVLWPEITAVSGTTTLNWVEICDTSGESIFASGAVAATGVSPTGTRGFTYLGSATLGGGTTINPVSNSSTTFYPVHYVGWGSGVTPLINVIGKK